MVPVAVFSQDSGKDAPAVAESVQIACSMRARIFVAGHLDNSEIGLVYAQIDECFHFETGTIDINVVQTVFPEGIISIAKVAKMGPKKHIDKLAQTIVAQVP